MEDHKERSVAWVSVPQFGDWDQKGVIPDYSMDFTKIREMRKQKKWDPSRTNEEELIPSTTTSSSAHNHLHHHTHSPTGRRSFFSCFNCCVKA